MDEWMDWTLLRKLVLLEHPEVLIVLLKYLEVLTKSYLCILQHFHKTANQLNSVGITMENGSHE